MASIVIYAAAMLVAGFVAALGFSIHDMGFPKTGMICIIQGMLLVNLATAGLFSRY